MTKWLAVAGVAILAVLLLLWKQLGETEAAPEVKREVVATAPTPIDTTAAPLRAIADTPVPAAEEKPEKIEVESDAFVFQFQDVVPKVLASNAAKCYEGIPKRVHRNQKISIDVLMRIKDGVVTVAEAKIKDDSLDNSGLTSCFLQEVQRATWTDHSLPDWEGDETLVLNPERGMKKFMRDNIDYVGAPAPD